MMLAAASPRRAARRAAFTLLEVLVVVAILVILAGVGIVATTRYLEDSRKNTAQLNCQGLAQAVEAYRMNPQSGNEYPETLAHLLQPPFGGTSFLKNGQNDLIDPWSHQYQYQLVQGADGAMMPLIYTTAPDGTSISQYGAGHLSRLQ
jgi:general secretion pathway protein G